MAQDIQTTIIPPTYTDGPLAGSVIRTAEGEGLRRITPDEIKQNFRRAMLRFNEKSCDWYITKYQGSRGKFVPEVRKRRADIIRAGKDIERQQRTIAEHYKKEAEFQARFDKFHTQLKHIHRYVVMCATSLLEMTPGTVEYSHELDVAIRNVGNKIHDLTKVYTGLISFEAWRRKKLDKTYDPTFEHYYPRSVIGGEDIIAQAMILISKNGGIDLKDMLKVIYECSQGNKTTAEENRKVLPPYQQIDTFISPQQTYLSGEITLVREQPFEMPRVWKEIEKKYNIVLPDLPEFFNVITVEEAELMLTQMQD
jgi:hypothetical protein